MEQQQNVLSGTKLIRKRDKRLKEYDISHIRNVIWAAYKELGLEKEFQEQIGHIIVYVNGCIFSNEEEVIDIEKVQDYVIESLNKVNKKVAKAYSDYREQRTRARERDQKLYKEVRGIIDGTNVDALTENANKKGHMNSTQRDLMAGELSKVMARNMIPKDIMDAHDLGAIKIHK